MITDILGIIMPIMSVGGAISCGIVMCTATKNTKWSSWLGKIGIASTTSFGVGLLGWVTLIVLGG